MKNVEFKEMSEEKAIEYFEKLYPVFKRFISGDKKIFEYGFHFDWKNIENRHYENLANDFDEDECDYYFIDKNTCEKYSLDISHDIDNFGYSDIFFRINYKEQYDDLYCCCMSAYKKYFNYKDMYLSIIFLYNKKEAKLVEILDISFYNPKINNTQTISRMDDEIVLEKIMKKQKIK